MPCPSCGHTLARICTEAETVDHWHCERCGTMVARYPNGHENVYVPKLVERCRQFEQAEIRALDPLHPAPKLWHRLGIAESINVPSNRPGAERAEVPTCPACKGSGGGVDPALRCPACKGSGVTKPYLGEDD